MTNETNYEAELRAANEELYKHSLELARLKQALEISKEQELQKAKEVAKLKDEFVFFAVHELKTPIVAIRGFLELTEDAQKNFPKDIQRNLRAISDASTHMSQLINDLLEIARSESGTMRVEVAPQEFKPILESVIKETFSIFTQKKLKLIIDMKPIPQVLCDTEKLKEVLENLVGNAIKYNKDGGIVRIQVYQPAGEEVLLCEVSDSGYGIPVDQQSKIFQKFFRAVSSETQQVQGSGLGLFITRMLVEKMGGSLMFTSVEHEGSTFAFTLPVFSPKK